MRQNIQYIRLWIECEATLLYSYSAVICWLIFLSMVIVLHGKYDGKMKYLFVLSMPEISYKRVEVF